MPDGLTAPKAAAVLSISAATLKDWSARLGIGQRSSSNGAWVYTGDDIKVLQSFQGLREEGHGLETITRKLRPLLEPDVLYDEPLPEEPATDDRSTIVDQQTGELTLIRKELVRVTDLARDYAQAAHQIGDLEATVRHLQSQLVDKDQQLKESRQVLGDGGRELNDTRYKLAELQGRLAQVSERSWWLRLFGG